MSLFHYNLQTSWWTRRKNTSQFPTNSMLPSPNLPAIKRISLPSSKYSKKLLLPSIFKPTTSAIVCVSEFVLKNHHVSSILLWIRRVITIEFGGFSVSMISLGFESLRVLLRQHEIFGQIKHVHFRIDAWSWNGVLLVSVCRLIDFLLYVVCDCCTVVFVPLLMPFNIAGVAG